MEWVDDAEHTIGKEAADKERLRASGVKESEFCPDMAALTD
jgi:hypothetical protein